MKSINLATISEGLGYRAVDKVIIKGHSKRVAGKWWYYHRLDL